VDRRRVRLAVVGLVLVAACNQDSTTPTERTLRPSASQAPASRAALEAQINSLINALYAPTAQGAIFSAFAGIKADLASGQTTAAQTDLVAFFSRLLEDQRNGILQDPNGAQPPTTAEALRSLLGSLATFSGVAAPIPPSSSDGAVAVIGTAGGTLVSSSGFGGVSFPAGALPSNVIVVINRLPAPTPPKTGPLPTALDQYPLFYDFSTIPALAQFNQAVTVGVCQLEVGDPFAPATQAIADRLQLAHPNPTNPATVEILPRVNADFMHCDGVSLASAETGVRLTGLASAMNVLSKLGTTMVDFFRPTPAYAVHGGLGGLTSSFSPFGAVDPGVTTLGVCSTPMNGVSATYATIELALTNVTPGGVIRLCPQTITLTNTVVVTKPVTIEGSDPANRPQITVPSTLAGITTFTRGTGFVVQPTIQGSVTFRNLAFTLTTTPQDLNVVAIDFGIGQGVANQGSWWQGTVERNTFTMPTGLGRAARAFQTARAHPKFTYQLNQSTGGGFAVVTLIGATGSDVEILSNSFTGPFSPDGVLVQNEGSVRVAGNVFTSCGGGNECVRVTHSSTVTITNNSFSIPSSGSTRTAISVDNADLARPTTATITNNTILGGGLTGPATDTASYRFRAAGILIGAPLTVTSSAPETITSAITASVSSNIVTNAASGIRIAGGGVSLSGTNNAISQAHSIVRLDNSSGTLSSLVTHGNDFTSFVSPVRFSWPAGSPSTIDVTCNWWGTAAGPLAFAAGIPTSMYVPFATGPVVNNAGGQCNGTNP
jgi:hypothetical protein